MTQPKLVNLLRGTTRKGLTQWYSEEFWAEDRLGGSTLRPELTASYPIRVENDMTALHNLDRVCDGMVIVLSHARRLERFG